MLAILYAALLASCQVTLPAVIQCGSDGASICPGGYTCDDASQLCIRDGVDAGRDVGPMDASSDSGEPGDGAVDADADADVGPVPDAGPLPPALARLTFRGEGTDVVEAVALDGGDIYIAGMSDSDALILGDDDIAVGAPGLFVAKLVYDGMGGLTVGWVTRPGGGDVVGGIALAGTGSSLRIIVGGQFTDTFGTFASAGVSDAFIVVLDAGGAVSDRHVVGSATADWVSAASGAEETACVSGFAGANDGGDLGVTGSIAGGFVACIRGSGGVEGGYFPNYEVADIHLDDAGSGWIAWSVDDGGPPPRVAAVPLGIDSRGGPSPGSGARGTEMNSDRPLRVAVHDTVPLLARGTERSVALSRWETPAGSSWEVSAAATALRLRMIVSAGRAHLVGRYDGVPTGSLLPPVPGAVTGFHTSLSAIEGDDVHVQVVGLGSEIRGIAASGEDLVFVGAFTDAITYPVMLERPAPDTAPDGFIAIRGGL